MFRNSSREEKVFSIFMGLIMFFAGFGIGGYVGEIALLIGFCSIFLLGGLLGLAFILMDYGK